MKRYLLPRARFVVLFLILVVSQLGLTAFMFEPGSINSSQASAQPQSFTTAGIGAGALETFTDATIQDQLEEYHIAGAEVSIVQHGKIELAKGYGYADVPTQLPVNPDETIFRIGSTSKLFIWTAVMQLAEQGKIDLSADINTYLPDFQIPATYPDPITMLNLLSHNSGFEERATGTEAINPDQIISLHGYLARYMPDRVRPAGEMTAYSNYGAALAGYIVEAVSGLPFEQYIQTKIFQPLSMNHSTFSQPLPSPLDAHLAVSYSYDGQFIPGSFTYVSPYPAASMSTTARDMANFMIAHLQDGQFEKNQILKPETVQLMHSHLFTNDDRLDGVAYGFFEETINGERILWHSGDIGNWHSILAIIPAQNLGFFVGFNSNEGFPAVNEFYYAFMNTFFPAENISDPPVVEGTLNNPNDLVGSYRSTRSIFNHVERIAQFPGITSIQVTVNPDKSLSISGASFYEKGFLAYTSQDGTNTLIFHQDGNGRITHMQFNGNPLSVYERVSWYETPAFNLLAFVVCLVLLLTALLAAIIGIFKRHHSVVSKSRLPGLARIWALALSTIFLVLPLVVNIYTTSNFKTAFPFYMVVTLIVILLASILVIGPVAFTILAWTRRYWSVAGRIHYTLVTLAMVGMVWLTYYWRLLGFRY
jgi:CubicO group peptidase (beta-lactamase class C family)